MMKNHNNTNQSALFNKEAAAQSKKISFAIIHTISTASNPKGISFLTVFIFAVSGNITADTHSIRKIFEILLPMIFPIARSVFPDILEKIFTTNSGIDVPKDTIVSPITMLDILNFLATEEAPSTKKSAPFIKITNHKTNNI